MTATVCQAVVRTRGAAPEPLLRELVRFGVTELLLIDAAPPLPVLPRDVRMSCLPLDEVRPLLRGRFLLCETGAVLDFNLARLLREAAPSTAVRDGLGLGIQLLEQLDAGAARPVEVGQLPCPHPRPALFLDRDGTINVDGGYVGTRERFQWMPGALDAIRLATEAGWHVFVVTNQSGVARGYFDEAAVEALHRWMVGEIRMAGGNVDDVRTCPFHEQGTVARYRRASDWRKPAPGMILDLVARWSLDRACCVLVGDQVSDMAAAEAAGISGHLFRSGTLTDVVERVVRQ